MNFDLKFFGDKLKKIREEIGYSFETVFSDTGIPIDTLKKFEKGLLQPSGDEILILIDFFKCDIEYFISNKRDTNYERTKKLFRENASYLSLDDRIKIQEFLFVCENEQKISDILKENSEFSYKVNPSYTTYSDKKLARLVASSFRDYLGLNFNKVNQNYFEILRKRGFHIFRRKLNNQNISGIYFKHSIGGNCILINYKEDLYRQNFTLAHELGHSLMDNNDINFSTTFDEKNIDKKTVEARANEFAAHFLFPEELRQFIGKKENSWNEDKIVYYCHQIGISPQVFIYSMKNSGIFTFQFIEEYKKLSIPMRDKEDPELKQVSSDSIRIAKTLLFDLGLTYYYIQKCYKVYEEGEISRHKLAELLLTDFITVEEILLLFQLHV